MSAGARRWTVRLTAAAESDFRDIVRWTLNEFGERQAHTYSRILSAALIDLTAGPSISGVRRRDDVAKGLFTLHVTRNMAKGTSLRDLPNRRRARTRDHRSLAAIA